MKQLSEYGQYKYDIFTKLQFSFEKGKKLLDIGCGKGVDAEIFIDIYGLTVSAIDIYQDDNIRYIKNLTF